MYCATTTSPRTRREVLVETYVRHASRRPRISKNASSWGRKNADRRSSTSTGSPSSSYAPWMDQPMRSDLERWRRATRAARESHPRPLFQAYGADWRVVGAVFLRLDGEE